ncbi:MAG: T9SS type A sorting domain-containing protein [Candidatus Kapabacteria bacterium]|nr:T9SS type A sorting domain-containing protein [Candidatus Kapabacteria bacterium]
MRSLFLLLVLAAANAASQPLYFPPASNDAWERIAPSQLGWCAEKLDSLVSYGQRSDTKALIILKDGKIAFERYFGTFTKDSVWYWASAGKTVTSVLIGVAQREGLLDITKSSATYLGSNWSSCTPQQESKITVRHHLTMTTGIGFERSNDDCTKPECLTYRAEPGTIWDYHNACYLLLQDMVAKATGVTYQSYYSTKLAKPLAMPGLWINGTLWSKPLAMARFGLMLLAGGVWNGDTIITDREYFNAMISTSQQLNKSYGYLYWLNGKGSFMQPSIPFVYPRDLVPSAPKDMYAGMGKNDQRVYVVPSQRMVVVRLGNPADTVAAAISGFDDEIWRYINALPCNTTVDEADEPSLRIWPNPASTTVLFDGDQAVVYDLIGQEVATSNTGSVDVSRLPTGNYMMVVFTGTVRSSTMLKVR